MIPGPSANPGKRDRRLGVADVKSCSGWPLPTSMLYLAVPKAGWPVLDAGLAGTGVQCRFSGRGRASGGWKASEVPHPHLARSNQRLHLTPR
jgi:hypothetical protein